MAPNPSDRIGQNAPKSRFVTMPARHPLVAPALFFFTFLRHAVGQAGDDRSILGGAEEVMVNPLDPGEEQTVCVMQQAPDYVRGTAVPRLRVVGFPPS